MFKTLLILVALGFFSSCSSTKSGCPYWSTTETGQIQKTNPAFQLTASVESKKNNEESETLSIP